MMQTGVMKSLFVAGFVLAAVAVVAAPPPAAAAQDPITVMVGRLNLESYKATLKELTQFGDRRQGTDRNRAATDWIEAKLKSYGYTNTARIKYNFSPRIRGGRADRRWPKAPRRRRAAGGCAAGSGPRAST